MILMVVFPLALAAAPPAFDGPLPGPVPAVVERVVDGDTLAVRAFIWPGHEVRVRVRLDGVDAPETWRPRCAAEAEAGQAAAEFLAALAGEGRMLRLTDIRLGSFAGRVVARAANEDGVDLSDALLSAGHAIPYRRGGGDWCGGVG